MLTRAGLGKVITRFTGGLYRRRLQGKRLGVLPPRLRASHECQEGALSVWQREYSQAHAKNMIDKDMQNSWQWRDWNDARADWEDENSEQTTDQSPPHAHIEHMQEHSQCQDNVPWRQHRDRSEKNESQTEPEKLYPRDERRD